MSTLFFRRGIEWVSLHSFLSYAYHNPGASGLVKNEVILTDILTGNIEFQILYAKSDAEF